MGAQEPCIRLWETQCLWLLSAASSPSPHYLWEPQLHNGKGQSGQTKAMTLQLMPCSFWPLLWKPSPFLSVHNVTGALGFLIYPHSAPRVLPPHFSPAAPELSRVIIGDFCIY